MAVAIRTSDFPEGVGTQMYDGVQAEMGIANDPPGGLIFHWAGEVDGKHYHFVPAQRFKDLIQEGAFIEHAEFSGNHYGTSFETVRQVHEQGRRCILDIEAQVWPPAGKFSRLLISGHRAFVK